jgi:hypothetical protein
MPENQSVPWIVAGSAPHGSFDPPQAQPTKEASAEENPATSVIGKSIPSNRRETR